MRLPEQIGVTLNSRRTPRLPGRGALRRERDRASRRARLVAGTLCGLGAMLFPGIALLALQASLAIAWAFLLVSLVVGGLRDRAYP